MDQKGGFKVNMDSQDPPCFLIKINIIMQLLLILSFFSGLFSVSAHSAPTSLCTTPLDILFLVDATDSMANDLKKITETFYDTFKDFGNSGRDVRFAVSTIGGQPSLLMPFIRYSKDTRKLFKSSLEWVNRNFGSSNGFSNQKTGLEALRMVLANNSGSDLAKKCTYAPIPCELLWSNTAERLIVMVSHFLLIT
jgi:hypothetical protein